MKDHLVAANAVGIQMETDVSLNILFSSEAN